MIHAMCQHVVTSLFPISAACEKEEQSSEGKGMEELDSNIVHNMKVSNEEVGALKILTR